MNGRDLGRDLERLPGVLAATVLGDGERPPLVYLATDRSADTEALRAAVLDLLAGRGVATDPARLHMAAPPRSAVPSASLPVFALDALDVHRSGGRVQCTVRLRTQTRSPTGSATEPDTPAGRARAGARAVLRAVETIDPDLGLGLHGVRPLDLYGEEAVLVLVELTAGRTHAHLPGVALLERSVEEAAALAVLTALRSWRI